MGEIVIPFLLAYVSHDLAVKRDPTKPLWSRETLALPSPVIIY